MWRLAWWKPPALRAVPGASALPSAASLRLHCEAMALHLLWRVTHAGMDELANWTAKTHKFAFQNSSGGPVRILLEEDPDGAPSILEI